MELSRILLIARRSLIARFLKIEDLIDFVFWPLLDIIIWGGVGRALSSGQANSVEMTLLCVLLMRIFLYSYFNNATNFLYEMMSRNIINLFSSPLTFGEWLCGAMVSGIVSMGLFICFTTLVAWLIFGVNILALGPVLVLFIIPLLISSWAISHLTILILMFFGVHAQRLAWVLGWLFIPFSGVYYSLDTMPAWIQTVSYVVPMSYIFTAVRAYGFKGIFMANTLACGYGLALAYFVIATVLCYLMFERSRKAGLASLERA